MDEDKSNTSEKKRDNKCYLKPECKKYCETLETSGKEPSTGKDADQKSAVSKKAKKFDRPYRISAHIDNYDIYNFGDIKSGFQSKVGPQDYFELRDYYLGINELFKDPEFPANFSSLGYTPKGYKKEDIKWKRPHKIVSNPKFCAESYNRFSFEQGRLGNCWFVSATALLTFHPKYFEFVVPMDQDFDNDYAGIFHFRFWQYGVWIDVVVDDRLPTYKDELFLLHSIHENEFWCALLEKAYAKLYGSYNALDSGSCVEAFEDFTGGVGQDIDIVDAPKNFFELLLKAYERMSFMCCGMNLDVEEGAELDERELITPEGLVTNHSYSITKIVKPIINGQEYQLIRLKNPWGVQEWKGAWSDGSPEWKLLKKGEKEKLELTFDEDGEFWMNYKDFMEQFSEVNFLHLNPRSVTDDEVNSKHKKKWDMEAYEGEWIPFVTAGGVKDGFIISARNPQYHITLKDPDDDDGKNCTLIVSVMQRLKKKARKRKDNFISTTIFLYLTPPQSTPRPLTMEFFTNTTAVNETNLLSDCRSVVQHFKLPPGDYCIVPVPENTDEGGKFLLRVFTVNKIEMEEYDTDLSLTEVGEKVAEKMSELKESGDISLPRCARLLTEAETKAFKEVAGDHDVIDYLELQTILNKLYPEKEYFHGFTTGMCRTLIALKDKFGPGDLDYYDFGEIIYEIKQLMHVWSISDTDLTGTMLNYDLKAALKEAGIEVPYSVLAILCNRYSDRNKEISLESFFVCVIKLKIMIDFFQNKMKTPVGQLNPDVWRAIAMASC